MRSIIRTIDVARPRRDVYDRWTQLEELPTCMPAVTSVRQLDDRTTVWVVMIKRERREFAAVVTEQRPDDRIAWMSMGLPAHQGVVTFHHIDPGTTRVTVQLDWDPTGTFEVVGDRLGIVGRHLDRALAGFAHRAETAATPVGGWRGTIEASDTRAGAAALAAAALAAADGEDTPAVERVGDDTPGARPSGAHPPRTARLGRTADTPLDIPAAGWRQTVTRAAKQLKADNIQILAAAVAFYLFLSLIPALGASISLYGLVSDPAEVTAQISELTLGLPSAARNLILDQAREVTEAEAATLSISLAVSVLVALFSASKGTQALVKALNIAYDEAETRGFVQLRALALGLTVGITALVVGVVWALVTVRRVAEDLAGGGGLVSALRWPVLGVVLVVVLAIMYRLSPDRDAPRWRWTSPGAVVAAVLLVLGSLGLSLYTATLGKSAASGLLGGVGVLLLWLFVSAYVILFGAELDAELERQTARDTTKGPSVPMGERGAFVADTVAR